MRDISLLYCWSELKFSLGKSSGRRVAARPPLNEHHHHQDRGQEAFTMSVLQAFGITYASGLALALLWIFASSIRTTLQLRRPIVEAPSDVVPETEPG